MECISRDVLFLQSTVMMPIELSCNGCCRRQLETTSNDFAPDAASVEVVYSSSFIYLAPPIVSVLHTDDLCFAICIYTTQNAHDLDPSRFKILPSNRRREGEGGELDSLQARKYLPRHPL